MGKGSKTLVNVFLRFCENLDDWSKKAEKNVTCLKILRGEVVFTKKLVKSNLKPPPSHTSCMDKKTEQSNH
jgi:hypothetical protein